jgi:ABC-type sulfate/molybdate transport systems ATPase subunit
MSGESEKPNTALKLEGVRRRVEDFVLSADFSLMPGERAALIGKSGIGKSTLLRLIAGLEPLDQGRVWIGDEDVTGLSPQKRRIGFVFQEAALFPSLDVLGNTIFGLLQHGSSDGMSQGEAEAEGLRWLDRVGLSRLAQSSVARLSGGEAQRVAFIRALIWKPRAILLDEPFSALDSELRADLRAQLLELHSHWPVPLLLVSHDAQDLDAIANVRLKFENIAGTSERAVLRSQ